MKFVGIDLHKQTIVLCVVGQDRKVLDRQTFHCADVERTGAPAPNSPEEAVTHTEDRAPAEVMCSIRRPVTGHSLLHLLT